MFSTFLYVLYLSVCLMELKGHGVFRVCPTQLGQWNDWERSRLINPERTQRVRTDWLTDWNLWSKMFFFSRLSLELICRALASILAPMSPIAFPLMSRLVREELLPSALRMMERSAFSLESARDSEVSGCSGRILQEESFCITLLRQNETLHCNLGLNKNLFHFLNDTSL